ncbi:MAG TPA: TetR family transcriptional regulator [Gemmatimonadales bacterium]|nr:TetR family transcriptional regulator [Gemmatimonadales bacterium]
MTERPKAAATKARILEAALDLFRERGYEAATMRAIAERAGVALGNAYYYFGSKEHLIQAFYDRTHVEHVAAVGTKLDDLKDLKSRLLWVMRKKLETIEPYHRFAGLLFRSAADPNSPLNPLSTESQPVRREATEVFRRVVEGSRRRISPELRAELPNLLWLYHMGIVLFWIHDTSKGRRRTWRLMERSVDLIVKLVGLASLPLMGPVRRAALRIVEELRDSAEKSAA